MSIKKSLLLVLVIIANTVFAQQSLNDYKYIIVPKKYDFLKSEDQYQVNSLTKFLFKKEGFETLFDNESKPQELAINPCLGLVVRVNNKSNMFTTKLVIELVNCKNEIIVTSEEGKSKQKEYKKGHQEALRNAFKSISSLNYKYNPAKEPNIVKKEETVLQKEPAVIVEEVIPATKVGEAVEKPVEVIEEPTPVQVEVIETPQKIIEVKKEEVSSNLLYAQANAFGYQLVDSTPKVIYVLLKSSKADVYFLKNKSGIIFKDGEKWFVEYYEGTDLVKEELQVKF